MLIHNITMAAGDCSCWNLAYKTSRPRCDFNNLANNALIGGNNGKLLLR